MAESETTIHLRHVAGYRFEVEYGDAAGTVLGTDEPPPLGEGRGPSPGRLLGSAVASCLMSSLVFCLGKREAELSSLEAEVRVTSGRNEEGRLRIRRIDVALRPEVAEEHAEALEKCRRVFEHFCVIGESVKAGIPIETTLA
jgi:organic hydroperoxide reductase OsmC/OhrA